MTAFADQLSVELAERAPDDLSQLLTAERTTDPLDAPRTTDDQSAVRVGPDDSPVQPVQPEQPVRRPARAGRPIRNLGDIGWRGLTLAAAVTTVLALGSVMAFLALEGTPAVAGDATDLPAQAPDIWALTWPLLFGSAWVSGLALAVAAPVGVGIALFSVLIARRRLGGWLGGAIDILAAVPSVVYGLWGLTVLAPLVAPAYAWLADHLGWLPFLAGPASATGRTVLTAAMVLAVMVLPLVASLSREVVRLVPSNLIEGALALGATRWEMIRLVVLPQARSGITAGVMLALGRALGETMAVAMVLSPTPFLVSFHLLRSENPGTVASFIAQNFPEAHGLETNALIWLGLVLFALTFLVNSLARGLVRSKGGRHD
ncbi:MAG: phosphate ABC transporter permease subunit PstC [Propionibacteriaceae bacterium]|nr:phosphate ABC transporter permease subunit PstC [Propionibacteriaceae bacterium]